LRIGYTKILKENENIKKDLIESGKKILKLENMNKIQIENSKNFKNVIKSYENKDALNKIEKTNIENLNKEKLEKVRDKNEKNIINLQKKIDDKDYKILCVQQDNEDMKNEIEKLRINHEEVSIFSLPIADPHFLYCESCFDIHML
jgi:hypothetical protein